jgi:hypothetical protein
MLYAGATEGVEDLEQTIIDYGSSVQDVDNVLVHLKTVVPAEEGQYVAVAPFWEVRFKCAT